MRCSVRLTAQSAEGVAASLVNNSGLIRANTLVDRQEIADQVYKGTYTPLYSFVPDGFTGATTVLKDLYGDGSGGPDATKAAAILAAGLA